MSREQQLDSTIDSILNEDKGVTTTYERNRNKDEETLYDILARMNESQLNKTEATISKLKEKWQGKKINESTRKNIEQNSKYRQETLYNSIDSML